MSSQLHIQQSYVNSVKVATEGIVIPWKGENTINKALFMCYKFSCPIVPLEIWDRVSLQECAIFHLLFLWGKCSKKQDLMFSFTEAGVKVKEVWKK